MTVQDRAGRVVAYCPEWKWFTLLMKIMLRTTVPPTSRKFRLITMNISATFSDKSTLGFARGISVLDLGCGTGRYFHCLRNVDRLLGVDISVEMLRQARIPVKKELIKINRIDLVCANVVDFQLPRQFDFIYSIGVFGEHVSWDLPTCDQTIWPLDAGGKLFFTVVDVFSKYSYMSKKRRLAETVNLMLPSAWKRRLRERLGTFYMTERELVAIFKKSKFRKYEIRQACFHGTIMEGCALRVHSEKISHLYLSNDKT